MNALTHKTSGWTIGTGCQQATGEQYHDGSGKQA